MASYEIEIEVTANRAEETQHPVLASEIGSPMADLQKTMKAVMRPVASMMPGHGIRPPDGGLAMKRVIRIRSESFTALAEILGRFERPGRADRMLAPRGVKNAR